MPLIAWTNMNPSSSDVCAVIVTLDPDLKIFSQLIAAISGQVREWVIVDNGSTETCLAAFKNYLQGSSHRHLILLGENKGIAAAHNCGIRWALQLKCSHILLLDHDSIPAADMVGHLLTLESTLLTAGKNVGAVGATSVDRRTTTRCGFVQKHGFFIRRRYPDAPEDYIKTDFLISSGTLIRSAALQHIGLMNEGYFIDHVDTEWCFRANHLGYGLFGSGKAILYHCLGDSVIKIWFARWREIPKHNPLRNYYMSRNTVRMICSTPMSMTWRLAHLYRLLRFVVFFLLVAKPRMLRMKMMLFGLLDARKGMQGIIPAERAIFHKQRMIKKTMKS
jgi:rhamnosyltransferase